MSTSGRFSLIAVGCLASLSFTAFAQDLSSPQGSSAPSAGLPGTALLELEEPLDVAMVRGISLHAERELTLARDARSAPWLEEAADSETGKAQRQAARTRVREMIGMPHDLCVSPEMKQFQKPISNTLSRDASRLASSEPNGCTISRCEWNAFDGVTGVGLIAIPAHLQNLKARKPVPLVVVIPDANQTPEAVFGLDATLPMHEQLARQMAEQGCIVLAPMIVNRDHEFSGYEGFRWTNIPHREFVYRTGFELGLHPVGYEVAKVITGIQAVQGAFAEHDLKAVVVGTGEGGLLALAAGAANDTDIDGVVVRGYFNARERIWEEPIYRNLYRQLLEFGDAELASLVAPRPLLIHDFQLAEVKGPAVVEGRANVAAPGGIRTPDFQSVQEEFLRARAYYGRTGAAAAISMLSWSPLGGNRTNLVEFVTRMVEQVTPEFQRLQVKIDSASELDSNSAIIQKERMKQQVHELIQYSQVVLRRAQANRQKLWSGVPVKTLESFVSATAPFRDAIQDTFIGRIPAASIPANARSREVMNEPGFTGYEVVLDVHPPGTKTSSDVSEEKDWGVIAGGILLLPKDLKPGQKRPVVVFQHGLEGTPMDTITTDQSLRAWKAYQAASTEMVKRGFIVYAPQNPFRGGDRFREIQRKSNPLGRSLFSYIIEQHRVTLDWLGTLPYVDADRIAFYGISYGGKTAMRVPAVLAPSEGKVGYCLSICSADFNDWIRKVASAEDRYTYVFTGEYEIFEWNMGHVANYAELAWLILPRPFMVERGLDDAVGPDDWVAGEFARVLRVAMKLGIEDRIELEVFNGPHAIHGVGTYRFLHKHLNWPEPVAQPAQ